MIFFITKQRTNKVVRGAAASHSQPLPRPSQVPVVLVWQRVGEGVMCEAERGRVGAVRHGRPHDGGVLRGRVAGANAGRVAQCDGPADVRAGH